MRLKFSAGLAWKIALRALYASKRLTLSTPTNESSANHLWKPLRLLLELQT